MHGLSSSLVYCFIYLWMVASYPISLPRNSDSQSPVAAFWLRIGQIPVFQLLIFHLGESVLVSHILFSYSPTVNLFYAWVDFGFFPFLPSALSLVVLSKIDVKHFSLGCMGKKHMRSNLLAISWGWFLFFLSTFIRMWCDRPCLFARRQELSAEMLSCILLYPFQQNNSDFFFGVAS